MLQTCIVRSAENIQYIDVPAPRVRNQITPRAPPGTGLPVRDGAKGFVLGIRLLGAGLVQTVPAGQADSAASLQPLVA
jgi:hypothetical protein